jgi:anti-sigma factor ChrR (cupin superfamily)
MLARTMRLAGLEVKLDERALAWRATRYPGVEWLPLHVDEGRGSERAGPREATVLIRMQPGSGYPAHRHVGVEEVLVLRGGYRDALGEHRAGEYLRYPAGSAHAPVALGRADLPEGPANPACLLFASARGGVEALEG